MTCKNIFGVDLKLSCFTLIIFMVAIILYPNLAHNIHYFGYFVSLFVQNLKRQPRRGGGVTPPCVM
jgi:hypothetical protein